MGTGPGREVVWTRLPGCRCTITIEETGTEVDVVRITVDECPLHGALVQRLAAAVETAQSVLRSTPGGRDLPPSVIRRILAAAAPHLQSAGPAPSPPPPPAPPPVVPGPPSR